MIDLKDFIQKKVLVPRNCGVKFRNKKDSLEIIKQNLEQLKVQGQGQSKIAKMYQAMLNASESEGLAS